MDDELDTSCLEQERQSVLLRKQGMFVLDTFKGPLTLEVISFRSLNHAVNTNLVAIP
jgi:hypothetical protein